MEKIVRDRIQCTTSKKEELTVYQPSALLGNKPPLGFPLMLQRLESSIQHQTSLIYY